MYAQRALARSVRSSALRSAFRRPYSVQGAGEGGLQGAADNAFNRERQAVKDHARATADTWRKLSIYVAIPCLIIAGANAYTMWNEHWEHKAHEEEPDHPEYQYQNLRTKNFFWGDGDKTLFWNENVNKHRQDE